MGKFLTFFCDLIQDTPPQGLTWWNVPPRKRRFLLKPIIFRFHVNPWGCIKIQKISQKMLKSLLYDVFFWGKDAWNHLSHKNMYIYIWDYVTTQLYSGIIFINHYSIRIPSWKPTRMTHGIRRASFFFRGSLLQHIRTYHLEVIIKIFLGSASDPGPQKIQDWFFRWCMVYLTTRKP